MERADSEKIRRSSINNLIKADNLHRIELYLDTIFRSDELIIVTLGNQSYGTILFHAATKSGLAKLEEFAMGDLENFPPIMRLEQEKTTITEINRRLPEFLATNYPEVIRVLPPDKRRIPKEKVSKVA